MHIHILDKWQHTHNFLADHNQAEKNTKIVLLLTTITMAAEVVAGLVFGSMALLADGWHMATHAAAFGITVFAYRYARKNANNSKYTFGTGKVSILGGFTSAVALSVIALLMTIESSIRLWQPQTIHFNEAIYVAILGLLINLLSAILLQDHHQHSHDDHESHDHHHDYNLHAAYIHVLADTLTSVLAIVALLAGKFLDWIWLDAVMGLVGAVVIAKWAYGLVKDTGLILLDGSPDKEIKLAIIDAIEQNSDNRVTDLHVWNLSQQHLAVTISLVTHHPQQPEHYKNLLSHISGLSHVVVEVNQCQDEFCLDSESGNFYHHSTS
ncbi:MAG: cation transporter [Limnothrix sp. CACIAM 69d]|nr:MAG: cation transporter [Limnothrix sp. CACIAM 69d]